MKKKHKIQNLITKKSFAFSLITISCLFSYSLMGFEYQNYEKKVKNNYSVRTLIERMPRKEIEENLRAFVNSSRPGRLVGTSGHSKAREYLESKLKLAGTGLTIKDEFTYEDKNGVNFIWEKKGITNPEQVIVLGAHYDTLLKDPKTKKIVLKGEMPGADNNASGVSALLSMMEILNKLELPKTVRLVFFDAEEWDAAGSKAFVKKYAESMSKEKILGFFNLTMLAHDTKIADTEKKQNNFKIYTYRPDETDQALAQLVLERGSKNYGTTKFSVAGHAAEGFPESAQSFTSAGIPAITITQNRETDLNPRYMTSNDFVETLNMATYTNVFKYVSSVVLAWNYDIVK